MAQKPIFYYDNASPPVRSVRWLIKTLNIDCEEIYIALFNRKHLSTAFLKVNPLHTVPVLQHNGLSITDSHAILIYLCEQFNGIEKGLWPTDLIERIKVLNKLFYSGTLLFRRDSDALSKILTGKLNKEAIFKHVVILQEQYRNMELFLKDSEYMAGDKLTIADFSIATIVSTVDILVPVDAGEWPLLNDWVIRMRQTPYYQITNDEGLHKMKTVLQKSTDYPLNI